MRALSPLIGLAVGFIAAGVAHADLRFTSFSADRGANDQDVNALLLDGGPELAHRPFRIVPLLNEEPSREAAAHLSDLDGRLDHEGRAMLSFVGGTLELSQVRLVAQVGGAKGQARQSIRLASGPTATPLPSLAVPSLAQTASPFAAALLTRGVRVPTATGIGVQGAGLSVASPQSGAVVGSPVIDVRGVLVGPFNSSLTTVTVNGVPAGVFPSASGRGQFLLTSFELSAGQNVLSVQANVPNGAQQLTQVPVQLSRATSNNVVIAGGAAIAARGTSGYAVMDLETRMFQTFTPPTGMNRVDDVAVADGFLFLLDAANGGRLASVDISGPAPVLLSGPFVVPVSPFAGVSAAAGRVVVSGGTGLLTVRSYNAAGVIGSTVASTDLGTGQPDVVMAADGARAYVSTDFSGTFGGSGFGITTINLQTPPAPPTIGRRTGIVGSGFTAGFLAPANFPIAAALMGDQVLVAHGAGVSLLADDGALLSSVPLGFPGTNVASDGTSIVAVGTGRRLAFLAQTPSGALSVIQTQTAPTPGAFTGAAMNNNFIAIAAGSGGLRVLRR